MAVHALHDGGLREQRLVAHLAPAEVEHAQAVAAGGEGAHGMLVLSPRAVERLESYEPPWPMPKIFRMTKKGKLDEALFTGATINTPSMVCVEDYLDALQWAQSQGGLAGLIKRSEANLEAVTKWVESTEWAHFLAKDVSTRSSTSVCLTLDTDPANVKAMVKMLEEADVAYDIGAYRDAPAGLRIWCGATVNTEDLEALFPWIEYAFAECS